MAVLELTTATRVKAYAEGFGGKSWGTTADALLAQVIPDVSRRVEQYLCRHMKSEARTEYVTLQSGQRLVSLKGFPVAASPAAVLKNDSLRTFGSDTVVTATNYFLDLVLGVVEFDGWVPVPGPGVLQVVYTGGMAADTASFVAAYPDIAGAADRQVLYVVQRRLNPGGTLQQAGGASATYEGPLKLLPDVEQALAPYRRVRHG